MTAGCDLLGEGQCIALLGSGSRSPAVRARGKAPRRRWTACHVGPALREVTERIYEKYNIEQGEALRSFLGSETYAMLHDPKLEMYDIPPIGIFDMWEVEQVTGDPRNSLYIGRDDHV